MNATDNFIISWNGSDGLTYKLYEIGREEIDEGSDEDYPAHNLIGLDSGNVRRFEETLDLAYDRLTKAQRQLVAEILESATVPDEARNLLEQYR